MTPYVPAGWPEEVRPPGSPDWERTATAYLFDCCPPDLRSSAVLRRHPVVLARFAAEFVRGAERAAREGVAGVRTGLSGLPPPVVQSAVDVWQQQQARLARTVRAVDLVTDALQGRVFVPRLHAASRTERGRPP